GAKNTDAIFSGKIQGNSLTKVGTGMLTLNDTCFYTANTTVNAGTLSLNTKGCIKGTLVVNNGGIVSGTGSVLGSISVNSGAIIQPGTTTLGTLKVGTSLVLNSTSTTIIRLNKTAKQQDSIRVKGVTLFGGTLNLTLTSGAFGIGDSVRVIKSATYSSKFNAIVPETPGNGLQWDQSTIAKDGYIRIVSSTGINDTWANNILLLPNPVKDVLTIQLESAVIKGRIKLLSVGGNLLFNKEIDGMSKVTVNMSSFASGFYMLIIDNGETVKKFKVVKN
ncbi:MAG TPA: T9SS type A sorting domain-containing protein, partial [Paludibacter sp.]